MPQSRRRQVAKREARDALEVLLSFTDEEEDQRLVLNAIGRVNELWPEEVEVATE